MGRQVMRAEKHYEQIVADTFATKTTGTISGRRASMLQCVNWFSVHGQNHSIIGGCHLCMCLLGKRQRGSSTRLSRFRQALAFAKFTIGRDVPVNILDSNRISGAAMKWLLAKGPTKQLIPLQ